MHYVRNVNTNILVSKMVVAQADGQPQESTAAKTLNSIEVTLRKLAHSKYKKVQRNNFILLFVHNIEIHR